MPWSRGNSTEKGPGHSTDKSASARVSEPTLAIQSWNIRGSPAVPGTSQVYGNSQISFGGASGARNGSSDVTTPTIGHMQPPAAPGLITYDSVGSTQSAPANSLQASRAIQKPVPIVNVPHSPPVPNLNDSTGAFGTERTETSSAAAPSGAYVTTTHVTPENVYDSGTVSLTNSHAVEKEKKVLEDTLESMVSTGTPFLLQYVMKGPVKWRLGSRGAVQFAKSRLTGEQVRLF